MDDISDTLESLSNQLADAVAGDPIDGLRAIGTVQTVVADHQRVAIRAAAQEHSWSEIGAALGVSKQAAHQRFAKEWAEELKGQLKSGHHELKRALKERDYEVATEARRRQDALIAEFRAARRANRHRRPEA